MHKEKRISVFYTGENVMHLSSYTSHLGVVWDTARGWGKVRENGGDSLREFQFGFQMNWNAVFIFRTGTPLGGNYQRDWRTSIRSGFHISNARLHVRQVPPFQLFCGEIHLSCFNRLTIELNYYCAYTLRIDRRKYKKNERKYGMQEKRYSSTPLPQKEEEEKKRRDHHAPLPSTHGWMAV